MLINVTVSFEVLDAVSQVDYSLSRGVEMRNFEKAQSLKPLKSLAATQRF